MRRNTVVLANKMENPVIQIEATTPHLLKVLTYAVVWTFGCTIRLRYQAALFLLCFRRLWCGRHWLANVFHS